MIVVMAHPERGHLARPLAYRIGASRIVYDPGFGDGDLLPDRDTIIQPNALRCARWAWRSAAEGPKPWACVVQDDALPCPSFGTQLLDTIWESLHAPAAVSFYYGAQSATGASISRHAATSPRGFVHRERADTYLATVAALVPAAWVEPWLAFSRLPYWSQNVRDDECWGAFLSQEALPSYATFPCLVDHCNDTPSVAGNEQHGPRRAAVTPPQGVFRW